MAIETTITLICDRCGSRHDKASYMAGNSWGQLNLTWQGDKGGKTWDGSAGGVELKGKAWLCELCTDAFLNFIKPEVPDSLAAAILDFDGETHDPAAS